MKGLFLQIKLSLIAAKVHCVWPAAESDCSLRVKDSWGETVDDSVPRGSVSAPYAPLHRWITLTPTGASHWPLTSEFICTVTNAQLMLLNLPPSGLFLFLSLFPPLYLNLETWSACHLSFSVSCFLVRMEGGIPTFINSGLYISPPKNSPFHALLSRHWNQTINISLYIITIQYNRSTISATETHWQQHNTSR